MNRTINSTWYEAVMVGGYGCKLSERFNSARDAKREIKKAYEREKAAGYKPSEYFVVMVNVISTIDENGDLVSKTMVETRI